MVIPQCMSSGSQCLRHSAVCVRACVCSSPLSSVVGGGSYDKRDGEGERNAWPGRRRQHGANVVAASPPSPGTKVERKSARPPTLVRELSLSRIPPSRAAILPPLFSLSAEPLRGSAGDERLDEPDCTCSAAGAHPFSPLRSKPSVPVKLYETHITGREKAKAGQQRTRPSGCRSLRRNRLVVTAH
jgi:hypothetical protein